MRWSCDRREANWVLPAVSFGKIVFCDVAAPRKYTKNEDILVPYREGDADASAVSDDPQAWNTAFPYGSAFRESLQRLDVAEQAVNKIAGDTGAGGEGYIGIEGVELGFGLRMIDDTESHTLFGLLRIPSALGIEPGANGCGGHSQGRIPHDIIVTRWNFLIDPAITGLLQIFQKPQACTNNLAGIAKPPGLKLFAHEFLVMTPESDMWHRVCPFRHA